jgi:glucosamine--fructose-6-phosphate aminotransferase (isomerizing)
MCGIVGIVGGNPEQMTPNLMQALGRLEYRGYDSAGLASLVGGQIERRRATGKLANLQALLNENPLIPLGLTDAAPNVGIGHTRWATHGEPSTRNAHPHAGERVALVHNGIIENYQDLHAELVAKGVVFSSETDTEVIAHLLDQSLAQGLSPQQAVAEVLPRLHGAFALAMIFQGHPDLLIGARRGSPLCLGFLAERGATAATLPAHLLASDALALAGIADRVTYLEEGDWVVLSSVQAVVYDSANQVVSRPNQPLPSFGAEISKGPFRHYMLKEIHEQPVTVVDSLLPYVDPIGRQLTLELADVDWRQLGHITLVGCGTAYYAAMVGKYWFESFAGLPAIVDIASEFRYRPLHSKLAQLVVLISQSGETADSLAALRFAKERGQKTLAIVNVPTSSMAREADYVLHTHAGPEISVASTKATTAQLTVLAALSLAAAKARGTMTPELLAEQLAAFTALPSQMAQVLGQEARYEAVSQRLAPTRNVLYIGRGSCYPIALEGALKLKEISYIHAEGFPAGELKHGPIALLDNQVPVITLAPHNPLQEKTISNMQEALARGAPVILFSDAAACQRFADHPAITAIAMPDTTPLTAPLIYILPMQLLAYYTAVAKGTDVDQPRNLAKSVTVE